jgi:ribonuclease HII
VRCAPCLQYTELPIPRLTVQEHAPSSRVPYYSANCYDDEMKLVVGIDEAGRGPIAGPVAIGIVAAPEDFDILSAFPGLNDSKKLTEKARERIFEQLEAAVAEQSLQYHVSLVSHTVIDEQGIVPAIRHGMQEGVSKLCPDPTLGKLWLDGALKVPEGYEGEVIIGGDGLIPAIMLASVAAKVTRDRYMAELANYYPNYGFESHKGYGTAAHYAAIAEHGLSVIHRRTYCRA